MPYPSSAFVRKCSHWMRTLRWDQVETRFTFSRLHAKMVPFTQERCAAAPLMLAWDNCLEGIYGRKQEVLPLAPRARGCSNWECGHSWREPFGLFWPAFCWFLARNMGLPGGSDLGPPEAKACWRERRLWLPGLSSNSAWIRPVNREAFRARTINKYKMDQEEGEKERREDEEKRTDEDEEESEDEKGRD